MSGTPDGVVATVPPLDHGEVQVWHAHVDDLDVPDGVLRAALSADELDRAGRFRSPSDASRFVRRRRLLRRLLAAYGADPGAAPLAVGRDGRPSAPGGSPLRFSAGSSDGMVVVAFAWDRDIGVDVERRRVVADRELLAQSTMTGEEQAALATEDGDQRDAAFLRLWTVKEAYLKALGTGLSLAPRRVSSTPEGPGRWTVSSPGEAPPWTAVAVDLGHAYIATLAVPGRAECLTEHDDDGAQHGVQLTRVVLREVSRS